MYPFGANAGDRPAAGTTPRNPAAPPPLLAVERGGPRAQCDAQPNCTLSIEIEPPSMPSTGNVTASPASPSSLAPSTYSSGR